LTFANLSAFCFSRDVSQKKKKKKRTRRRRCRLLKNLLFYTNTKTKNQKTKNQKQKIGPSTLARGAATLREVSHPVATN
jgi:hypothetical protein